MDPIRSIFGNLDENQTHRKKTGNILYVKARELENLKIQFVSKNIQIPQF